MAEPDVSDFIAPTAPADSQIKSHGHCKEWMSGYEMAAAGFSANVWVKQRLFSPFDR